MREVILLVTVFVVVVIGAGLGSWYFTHASQWPQDYRDTFVKGCALTGGQMAGAGTTSAQAVVAFCECVLTELERRLTFDEMKREEALLLAGGFRLTPVMEQAAVACRARPRQVPLEGSQK